MVIAKTKESNCSSRRVLRMGEKNIKKIQEVEISLVVYEHMLTGERDCFLLILFHMRE